MIPTLRRRMALRASIFTLVGTVTIGVTVWTVAVRNLRESIESSARDYLVTLTDELDLTGDPLSASVAAPILGAPPDRLAEIVRLRDGEVVASTPGLGPRALVDPEMIGPGGGLQAEMVDPRDGGRILVVATTVPLPDGRYGVIAGASLRPLDGASRLVTVGLGAVAPLVAALMGLVVWASVRSALTPVERLAGEADRVAGSIRRWSLDTTADTREIAHLTERLNSLLGRIHDGQERERAFLDDASHELRTPIAIARAELDLARTASDEPGTRAALESAIEELDRLDRLADDLLVLARARSHPAAGGELVNLGGLARQAAARLMRDPQRRPAEVTVSGDGTVRGDSEAVERAVSNVIANAVRHCDASVAVQVWEEASRVGVVVRDDGPGFPPELLASATERFIRDAGRRDGSGLGLAIASAIVEAHRGQVRLENPDVGGAEVSLWFPLVVDVQSH